MLLWPDTCLEVLIVLAGSISISALSYSLINAFALSTFTAKSIKKAVIDQSVYTHLVTASEDLQPHCAEYPKSAVRLLKTFPENQHRI